jgi:transposase
MAPRYKITLTRQEREQLEDQTRNRKTTAVKFVHARALLLCDAGPHGDPWKVADVAQALGITPRTVEHLKQRFVEEGIETALERRARTTPPKVTYGGEFDARLTALACSPAPDGRARWTVRLLAEKLVELKIAPSVSAMTVHRSLKKTNCSLIGANTGRSRRTATRPS